MTHERLTRACFIDYNREMALVAEIINAETADAEIVAVGRLTREHSSAEAEFALLVSDPWHERGLGTELLRRLVAFARNEGIHRVFGQIMTENRAMQEICRQLGFEMRYSIEDGVVEASIAITEPAVLS